MGERYPMTTMDDLPQILHHLMMAHVIETGHAPDIQLLSALANRSLRETENALRQLESIHGVILVPNSFQVWSLHPFAMTPTRFWVTSKRGGWWANCAWCALGIAAALQTDVRIITSDGAEDRPLEMEIKKSKASHPDVLFHFP